MELSTPSGAAAPSRPTAPCLGCLCRSCPPCCSWPTPATSGGLLDFRDILRNALRMALAPDSRLAQRVLPDPLYRALTHVYAQRISGCMLAGGTAISGYYAGHRRSDDLELFAKDEDAHRAAVLAARSLAMWAHRWKRFYVPLSTSRRAVFIRATGSRRTSFSTPTCMLSVNLTLPAMASPLPKSGCTDRMYLMY